jgi:hypothetical protein
MGLAVPDLFRQIDVLLRTILNIDRKG